MFSPAKKLEWNKNHIENWKKSLEVDKSGLNVFQKDLLSRIEKVLQELKISYTRDTAAFEDSLTENKVVKIVRLTLHDNSRFWISYDMAELEIKGQYQIYEQWAYLTPEDLAYEYLQSAEKLLKTL